jgi:hypothetical protein
MGEKQITNTGNQMLDLYDRISGLWQYIIRRWWILLLAAFIGGIIGVVYAYRQPPKYQSLLTFALEDNNGGLGGAFSLAAEFGLNLGSSGKDVFAGENILAILTSRRLVESVLLSTDTVNGKQVTLADLYLKITKKDKGLKDNPRLNTIHFPPNFAREKFSYLQDSILYTLYSDITKTELLATKPDRKLNIYKVEFTSAEERFSKIFTERLVDQANQFYTELRTKRSLQTLQILESRAEAMRGSAKSAIQSRAGIEDANVNPAYSKQNALLQSKSVDISAYGAAYGELFKNLEIARYNYLKEMPLMQVIDEPHLPMKNLKKGRLRTGILAAFVVGFLAGISLIIGYFLSVLKRNVNSLRRSVTILPGA